MVSFQQRRWSKLQLGSAGLIGLAVVATAWMHFSKRSDIAAIREARASVVETGPRVEVVAATAGPKERLITLLADVRPYASATLYAKVAGYLKSIKVDKGDRVEAGQVLAEIESPEIDQQYASAVADLENKRRNKIRIADLAARAISSQVLAQQAETDATMAEANVSGLATMKSYQTVRAPFAGRIASRFVDPGALITNAQTNFTSAQPLLALSDDTKLRIYVYIQQQDVPFVHMGDPVDIVDASNASRKMQATVTRTTGELDPKTRTMLVEVDIDNSSAFLVPGSFAYVVLHIPVTSYPTIPVAGLIVRGEATFVATVDQEVVKFKPVKVAVTDGAIVSLNDGLNVGDRIAINLPDEVVDGSRVRVVRGASAR